MSDDGRLPSVWADGPLPSGVHAADGVRFERHEVTFRRYRSEREVGLRIGPHARIHTWTEFSIEPEGQVIVGARSVLVGATIMCADCVEIGDDVVISYDVTITDCDFHPIAPEPRREDAVAISPGGDKSLRHPLRTAPVLIEDGARIGIGAVILKGVRVGAGAEVRAGSVVTHDVPPGTTVAGNPAQRISRFERGAWR